MQDEFILLAFLVVAQGLGFIATQYIGANRLAELAGKLEKSIPPELLPVVTELVEAATDRAWDMLEAKVLASPGQADDEVLAKLKELAGKK